MNTKKIIIILAVLAVLLGLILLVTNLPKNNNSEQPGQQTTNLPTGVIVPTKQISQGSLDIVAVEPQDSAQNIASSQTIVITFSRPYNDSELTFFISPSTSYSTKKEGNKLLVSPQGSWQPGTQYTYSVNFRNDDQKVRLYRFTTTGPTQQYLPDTQPEGAYEEEQSNIKNDYPDLFVKNNTPYEATTFSIRSSYEPNPPDHFYFQVTPKIPDTEKVKQDLNIWLQLLDLSAEQIESLDIRYE